MTGQEQQQQPSAFAERADSAGLKLKEQLSQRLGIDLPETKVAVGPDGQPPQALPPEGSYARQMMEQQQQQQAAAPLPPQQQQAQQEGTQQASQPPQGQPQHQQAPVSDNAQRRITELVTQLREKDQAIQQLQSGQSQTANTVQELQARLDAQTQQYEQLVQNQLDHLEPEERMQVLNSAAIREAVAASESRIMAAIAPQFEIIKKQTTQQEYADLGLSYGSFRPEEHIPLIEAFRERNPNCTVDQAFRAVATAEELGVPSVPAPPVPPVVAPGSGAAPRYVPETPADPQDEMVKEAAMARDLARSTDPADHKKAQQLFHKNITDRLGGSLPGQR